MTDFRSNVKFNKNQALNLVLHKTTAAVIDLTSPIAGQVYYDTTANKAYYHNGTGWVDMTGGAVVAFTVFSDGTNTATADSATDTFKLRTANNLLTVLVANDDATHGDNVLFTVNQANIDHGTIAGLADDDHSQYALLLGRSTGQIFYGATTSAGNSFLASTFHATKGKIYFGINTSAPAFIDEATGDITGRRLISTMSTGTSPLAVTSTTVVANLNADLHDGYDTAQTSGGVAAVVVTNSSGKIDVSFLSEQISLSQLSDVTGKTGTGTTVLMDTNPSIAGATFSADLAMGGFKITNLGTPTQAADAATKSYVDNVSTGLDVKKSVRVATTATVGTVSGATLTSTPTVIDGITLVLNDRILVKNHTTTAANGIYSVTTLGTGANGVWTRATDFDESAEVTGGAFTFVEEGTVNADTGWVMTTDGAITIGTTALTWTQFAGAGSTLGANLGGSGIAVYESRTGNTLNFRSILANSPKIDVTLNSGNHSINIDVVESQLQLAYIGGTLPLSKGGTGSVDAASARTALGLGTMAVGNKFSASIGDGSTNPITVTHNLGNTDVHVMVYEISSKAVVMCDVEVLSTTQMRFTFTTAPTTNQYRVIIMG